jgi:Carboxypeptidase regulatory-like domain
MLRLARGVLVVACVGVLSTTAYAQSSSITGVVRDASGAVLPGVSVEAASPELIEKVRSAISDGTGTYRIIDLRPGTYTVTFTLPGFATVKREGLLLPADFVSTVNAEMKIGTLEETINVAGESPIVDVQTTKTVKTLDLDLIQSIPTARGYAAVMLLIPSMIQSGGGNPNVQLAPGMIVFGGRGGRGNEGQSQLDGLGTGAAINGGGVSGYGQLETAQEVVMTTAGGLGESEVGGPIVNMIPKTGGNTIQNHFYGSGMSGWMQSNNYGQILEDFSNVTVVTPQKTNYLWDVSHSIGGPVKKDRLWFFFTMAYMGNGSSLPGMYYNKNEGDITKWLYEPDFNRPASNGNSPGTVRPTLRLTAQASPRNKFNMFWDPGVFRFSDRPQIGGITGPTAGAPETGTVSGGTGWKQGTYGRLEQLRWTQTTTSRLLLEAGLGTYQQNWNGRERPGNNRDLIPVTEQCTAGCPANGNIQGLVYRAQNWNTDFMEPIRWNASATYVTGAHNMKAGYIGAFYWVTSRPSTNNYNLAFRVNNGLPNQITQNLNPWVADTRVRMNALYIQDQWTKGRMTLQGAMRYDKSWSYYVEQQVGPTRFLPTPVIFPESKGVIGYHDINPRVGIAYDLFGNGRTALKFNAGRYLEAAVGGNGNYSALLPSSRLTTTTSRSWTDANRNFNPDCDLSSGVAQDLRTSGGDFCGAWTDQNFGKPITTLSYDEQILKGWYNRPSDWIIGATVQHELVPRVSVSAGYTRRWLQNFTVTDNLLVSPADYTPFSIVAPTDPRLPGGGGYVVDGLFDISQAKFSAVDNYRTYSPAYGNISQMYNGVDLNVTARIQNGLQLQFGAAIGSRVTDYCEVRAQLPEQGQGVVTGGLPGSVFSTASEVWAYSPLNPYCHFAPGVDGRYTGVGTYTIPKVDVLLSATMTSSPGIPLRANWTIPSAQVAQWLGRAPSGNVANITVNLLKPDDLRSDRVNELDFRIAKLLRFGSSRANIALDLYNALNADTILQPNQAFSSPGGWLTPTGTQTPVMTARTAKITVQYDF